MFPGGFLTTSSDHQSHVGQSSGSASVREESTHHWCLFFSKTNISQHHGWPHGQENKLAAVFQAKSSSGKASQKGNKPNTIFKMCLTCISFIFINFKSAGFFDFAESNQMDQKGKRAQLTEISHVGLAGSHISGPLHPFDLICSFFPPNLYFLEFV